MEARVHHIKNPVHQTASKTMSMFGVSRYPNQAAVTKDSNTGHFIERKMILITKSPFKMRETA
jgi:hypothetical protein